MSDLLGRAEWIGWKVGGGKIMQYLFHRECMLEWFEHKNTYPLCRKIIFKINRKPTFIEQAAHAEIMQWPL